MKSFDLVNNQKTRVLRILLFLSGFVFVAGISIFIWFKIDPISFRRVAFEPIRDFHYFYRELQPVYGLRQLEVAPNFKNHRVEIPTVHSNDLSLIADLWTPENGQGPYPALLILHGSSQQGRLNGLGRMFAHEFQQRDWVVLTPDARGFNESEAPANIQDPKSWRVAEDISRCIGFLYGLENVDQRRIVVLGHSMGGASALEGALTDSRIAALILIGPPRYLSSREASYWERIRFSADRKLKDVIAEKVMADRRGAGDISLLALKGSLKETSKPILLLDGELESEEEHLFLQEVSRKLSATSEYLTVPGVGHYCGVYHLPGTPIIFLRQDLFERCLSPTKYFVERHFQNNLGYR